MLDYSKAQWAVLSRIFGHGNPTHSGPYRLIEFWLTASGDLGVHYTSDNQPGLFWDHYDREGRLI